jgi:hypothetical protein
MDFDKKQIEADIKILDDYIQKEYYNVFSDKKFLAQVGIYFLYKFLRDINNPPRTVEAAWRRLHILGECLQEEQKRENKEKKK